SGHAPVARAFMNAMTAPLSTTQAKLGAAPLQLAAGFADFLFIAVFFACFAKFGIPSKRTFTALVGTLSVYMLAVFYTGSPLPALVPIAAVIIGMNARRFKYARDEAFALLYAGLIVAA